ncbi:hypothetical protein HHI36_001228 [Cryptolaemus montrouzieri]|uniref:Reverse transcriptase/retrotransposon-derived protein RNase H-like domain-containing protein n=1 Tax=Cryptolaemus montrouzieri TaxID=559131 RepID=A0ABD2P788_9CUCU
MNEDSVILKKELCDSVFMAGIMTSAKDGEIPKTKEKNSSTARVKQLLSLLKLSELNREEQTTVMNICAEFNDIFHLPEDNEFTLQTNASGFAIGAILQNKNGEPVAYASREYVKGGDSAAADALSRVIVTSDDLKSMNASIISALTRAQKKAAEEGERLNNTQDFSIVGSDQPGMVEILKKPSNSIKLVFSTGNDRNQIANDSEIIISELGILCYVLILYDIFVKPKARSTFIPVLL